MLLGFCWSTIFCWQRTDKWARWIRATPRPFTRVHHFKPSIHPSIHLSIRPIQTKRAYARIRPKICFLSNYVGGKTNLILHSNKKDGLQIIHQLTELFFLEFIFAIISVETRSEAVAAQLERQMKVKWFLLNASWQKERILHNMCLINLSRSFLPTRHRQMVCSVRSFVRLVHCGHGSTVQKK